MYDNASDWNYLGQHSVEYVNADILMSPSLVGMASATVRPFAGSGRSWESLYASLTGKYVGKQYFDNTSSDERSVPAYFVGDLALGYRVPLGRSLGFARDDRRGARDDRMGSDPSVSFSFHINNVFNRMYYADAWVWRAYFRDDSSWYSDIGLYPQAPLNAMFKVAFQF